MNDPSSRAHPLVEEYLRKQSLRPSGLARALLCFLADGPSGVPPLYRTWSEAPEALEDRNRLRIDFLRWAVSDRPESRMQWEILSAADLSSFGARDEKLLQNRDALVERFWRETTESDQSELLAFMQDLGACSYYRRRLHAWFVGRFNFPAARRMYRAPEGIACCLHWLLLISSGAVLAVAWAAFGVTVNAALAAVASTLALWFGLWRSSGLPLETFVVNLVPRLGAAVGIGYLFLLAAPNLTAAVMAAGGTPGREVCLGAVAGLLVGGSWCYTLLHIHRRVHPPLPFREAAQRALDVLGVALSHALLGIEVFAPLLFHESQHQRPLGEPRLAVLAVVTAVALSLGMVLQVAWDEQPLTEPL